MSKNASLRELIEEALSCEDRGEIKEAVALLRRVVGGEPRHAAAWRHLGVLLAQLGDERCAISWQHRVIYLGADTPALSRGGARAQEQYEEYVGAREALEKGLALEPTAGGYVLLGDVHASLGHDAEAEESFRIAMKLDPDWDEALFNLAVLYRTQQPEEAERLLRRAVEIDPEVPAYHRELGSVLARADLQEAETSLRRALKLDSNDFWTHVYLGTVLEGQGRDGQAETEYNTAVELQPSLALLHVCLGNFLSRAKRLEDAEHRYRTAVRIEPDDPYATYKLGVFLREHGDGAEAASWLRKYVDLDPSDDFGNVEEVRRWLAFQDA